MPASAQGPTDVNPIGIPHDTSPQVPVDSLEGID
jgi:hypothetical protein